MAQTVVQVWGDVHLYSLKNIQGTQVDISELGATIVNFFVNDKHHKQHIILLQVCIQATQQTQTAPYQESFNYHFEEMVCFNL